MSNGGFASSTLNSPFDTQGVLRQLTSSASQMHLPQSGGPCKRYACRMGMHPKGGSHL